MFYDFVSTPGCVLVLYTYWFTSGESFVSRVSRPHTSHPQGHIARSILKAHGTQARRWSMVDCSAQPQQQKYRTDHGPCSAAVRVRAALGYSSPNILQSHLTEIPAAPQRAPTTIVDPKKSDIEPSSFPSSSIPMRERCTQKSSPKHKKATPPSPRNRVRGTNVGEGASARKLLSWRTRFAHERRSAVL